MTKMTTNEIELCRTVPIHRLVGDTRINKKIKIKCPFHAEKTGSCNLFPTGGYHCFGCGANGNTIDFVVKLGGTFEEAVLELKKYI